MSLLLRLVDEVDSTNDLVRDGVRDGTLAHGEAIQALAQRAGRGRLGRRWHSPAGSHVYLSVAIVRPVPVALVGWLPLAAGVATAELVARRVGDRVGLKWPNDVLAEDRKIAGVLCEGVAGTSGLRGAVVGVGLNVADNSLPAELIDTATSLCALGCTSDVREVGAELRLALVRWCDRLLDDGAGEVAHAWAKRDVTSGRRISLPDGSVGMATGLADDGALQVDVEGTTREVRAGEVVFAPGAQRA